MPPLPPMPMLLIGSKRCAFPDAVIVSRSYKQLLVITTHNTLGVTVALLRHNNRDDDPCEERPKPYATSQEITSVLQQ